MASQVRGARRFCEEMAFVSHWLTNHPGHWGELRSEYFERQYEACMIERQYDI